MPARPLSDARLGAAEEALRKVQAQAAALEELSEQLSLSVSVLEAEIAALSRQARSQARESTEPATANQAPAAPPRSTDVDGARLVALNMALEGDAREVVGRYLEERFDIADSEQLLNEVYAAVNT